MVPINIFQLNFGNSEADRMVKTESSSSQYARQFHFPHHQELNHSEVESIKAKIVAHPQYPELLDAYIGYQNVGAPPEVVAKLLAARQESEARQGFSGINRDNTQDRELDRFMETYCGMLVKCREELKRTLQEGMNFMQNMEAELNMLSDAPVRICNSEGNYEDVGTSEEDQENNYEESGLPDTDPRADDRDIKNHLLRKYGTHLSGLKQELSKKRKKGKLPKDARQKLLNWWEQHYKWPYPSEAEKTALAESTCLDQKQINNWFINQRKRHWKPSEDMPFTMIDCVHSQSATLCMEGHYMDSNPPYRFGP